MDKKTIIITPHGQSLLESVKELFDNFGLVFVISEQGVTARYKQALIGIGWALLHPVGNLIVFTVVFGNIIRLDSEGIPYALFCFTGLLVWNLIAGIVHSSAGSIAYAGSLLKKTYMPAEILPLSSIPRTAIDTLVSSIVLIFLMAYNSYYFTLNALFFVPILLIAIITAAALGLVLSALIAIYRDISFITPFVMQAWMFATPIMYSYSPIRDRIGDSYLYINPAAFAVESARVCIVHGRAPDMKMMAIELALSLVFLFGAYLIFKKMEPKFRDML